MAELKKIIKIIKMNLFGKKKAKVTEYEKKMLEEKLLDKLFDFDMVYVVSPDPIDTTNKDEPERERPDLLERLKRRYEAFVSDYGLELYEKTDKLGVYQTEKDSHEDTRYVCDITLEDDNAIINAYLDRNGRRDTIVRDFVINNPLAIILYRKGISWVTNGYLAFKGGIREGEEYHNEIAAIVLFDKDKIGVIRNSEYKVK